MSGYCSAHRGHDPDCPRCTMASDHGALDYGPGEYDAVKRVHAFVDAVRDLPGVTVGPVTVEPVSGGQVPDEARQAAAAVVRSRYSGTLNDRDEAVLEAAVPVVRAAQRATVEAEFAARMDTWQQAMAAIVRKAADEARQDERERFRRLVESYKGSWPFQPPEVQAELLLERLLSQIGAAL